METLQILLGLFAGSIPLVIGQLRKTRIVEWVKPELISGVLAIAVCWLLSLVLVPDMTFHTIVILGLAVVGGSTVATGAAKYNESTHSLVKGKNMRTNANDHSMFTKLLFLLLIPVLMLASAGHAQTDTTGLPTNNFGYTFGTFITEGHRPVLGHVIDGQIGVKTITKNILTGVEVSSFFSNEQGNEFALRSFVVRDVDMGKGFLAGVGVGAWDFIDTEGEDVESAAITVRGSYTALGLSASVGGDYILMSNDETPNAGFVFAKLAIGL